MKKNFDIIIIDDTPQNLKLLIEILKDENYSIKVFPSAKLAKKAIETNKPDLILLDINMPEITGFEFAKFLKSNHVLKDIPIIFITASNSADDKVRAFSMGGTDYITKPFQVEEVLARITHQLKIKIARKELEDSLALTLNGAISLLTDILSIVHPELFNKSIRLKNYTKRILKRTQLKNKWVYEISAMLSQIGCISLPEKLLKKKILNIPLTEKESDLYNHTKSISSNLVSRIPKLEVVSKIVSEDYSILKRGEFKNENEKEIIKNGIDILKLIEDFDSLMSHHNSINEVEIKLKENKFLYNKDFLDILLEESHSLNTGKITKKIPLKDVEIGMVLLNDIYSEDGVKVLSKNTIITDSLLHLIELYTLKQGLTGDVLVMFTPNKK